MPWFSVRNRQRVRGKRGGYLPQGFPRLENPMDVFGYYNPADSRYCEVDLDTNEQTEEDSKRVGKKIKIETEIGLSGLIQAGVKFILEKVDFKNAKESNTGNWSAATNTGNRSAATNTGNRSAATNTGDRSAATNTGNRSAATVGGAESIAVVTGYGSKAKGAVGCWLVLTERDEKMHILGVQAVCVDGETIKADTFYMLKNGAITEVNE
jgi:hypothetical protein